MGDTVPIVKAAVLVLALQEPAYSSGWKGRKTVLMQRESTWERWQCCCSRLWCPAAAVSRTTEKMATVRQSKGKHNTTSSPEPKMIALDQKMHFFFSLRKKAFKRPRSQKTENKC